ncbi:glycosyltransferase [Candidatus Margulisiibacteriota bacterium]
MFKPLVSVNIPIYQGERFLEQTIKSVLDQTYQNFEIVLIIDGTNDRSEEIIKKCQEKYPKKIRYQWQKNVGLAQTRNNLIKLSKGEYIAILDQDDYWKKDKLEKQIALFEKKPELGLVFSSITYINEKNEEIGEYHGKMYRGYIFNELYTDYFIPCPTIIFKKELINKIGYFDPAYKYFEEVDFAQKASLFYEFDYLSESTCFYRKHENNTSNNDALWAYERYKCKKNIYHYAKRHKFPILYESKIKKEIMRFFLIHLRTQFLKIGRVFILKGAK